MAVTCVDGLAFERYDLRRVGNELGSWLSLRSGAIWPATSAALASDHRWISGELDSVRCRVLPSSLSHRAGAMPRKAWAKTLRRVRLPHQRVACMHRVRRGNTISHTDIEPGLPCQRVSLMLNRQYFEVMSIDSAPDAVYEWATRIPTERIELAPEAVTTPQPRKRTERDSNPRKVQAPSAV